MAYLVKEKFNLLELVAMEGRPLKLVLVAEPEEYLLSLYSYHLKRSSFKVAHCREANLLSQSVREHRPDLLIVNMALLNEFSAAAAFLRKLREDFAGLPVVTIGYNLSGNELSHLMSAGISSHIDRKFTRPMDIVHVAKAILNH